MKKSIARLLVLFAFFWGCKKVNYYEDNPITYTGTKKLAHRGGRNAIYPENTYEGCVNALDICDGIEVDVQISKDRTIWLSHSGKVIGCETERDCFAETTDAQIAAIKACGSNKPYYTKLEDIMQYMYEHNIRKYISIDMKGWFPCQESSLNIEAIMRLETELIIDMAGWYNLQEYIIIENSMPSVLKWAEKKNRSTKTFLVSYGDYEKALLQVLKHNFDGISYKTDFGDELKPEHMNLLHKKGKMLMGWNIADSSRMEYFESIQVDILQIDI